MIFFFFMFYRNNYLLSIDENENTEERKAGNSPHFFEANTCSVPGALLTGGDIGSVGS